jgi:hypothetical protein
MNNPTAIDALLAEICRNFPEVAPHMDGHETWMRAARMEAFAEVTTQAFSRGEAERGRQYLEFMAARLDGNDAQIYEYIDVYYVENLFWDAPKPAAERGWRCLPENLKDLYLKFHKRPPV